MKYLVLFVIASSALAPSAHAYCSFPTLQWDVQCAPVPSAVDPTNLSNALEIVGAYSIPNPSKANCAGTVAQASTGFHFHRNYYNLNFGLPRVRNTESQHYTSYVYGRLTADFGDDRMIGTLDSVNPSVVWNVNLQLAAGIPIDAHVDMLLPDGSLIERFYFPKCALVKGDRVFRPAVPERR